jgi:hypothetical protein
LVNCGWNRAWIVKEEIKMSDNLIFGEAPLLPDFNVPISASEYQDDQIGGGGGPSSAETVIESMYASWSAPVTAGDEWAAYMADGAIFYDDDGNGYYDNLELVTDNGIFAFDPETGCWVYRALEDEDVK